MRSGLVPLVMQEGPPLLPFGEEEMQVEDAGTVVAQDDALVG